jgi:phospholipid/cholesterol/gamma-HCH transport system permease protein
MIALSARIDAAPVTPAAEAAATVAFDRTQEGALVVLLSGTWRLGAPRPDPQALARELGTGTPARVVLDAQALRAWDTALLAWLRAALAVCAAQQIEVDRTGLPPGVRQLLHLAEIVVEPARPEETAPATFVGRVGAQAARMGEGAVGTLRFLGNLTLALGRFVTLRAQFRRADLYRLLQGAGAEAVPIITLISLIVGMIVAFVGAVQLRLFGADLYVANLVGIAMVREMGAMVVGIIMAGRTGAAYAAQLGTMKVTEEIDALATFGISPIDFLVVPRVVALFLMVPFLCLYSMVLGILGGALVGVYMLGLSPHLYLDQTIRALSLSDLWGGVFRGALYGVLVGITGCLRGMRCGRDAAAVGAATTRAVVTGVVAIVVADGVLAVVFNALGI